MLPSIDLELLGPYFTSLPRFEVGRTQCKKVDVTYMHRPIKIQITTATQIRCKFLCVSLRCTHCFKLLLSLESILLIRENSADQSRIQFNTNLSDKEIKCRWDGGEDKLRCGEKAKQLENKR